METPIVRSLVQLGICWLCAVCGRLNMGLRRVNCQAQDRAKVLGRNCILRNHRAQWCQNQENDSICAPGGSRTDQILSDCSVRQVSAQTCCTQSRHRGVCRSSQ